MKKTTKFLLVLAAVVAMTIGAVSTVMADDEVVTIGAWGGDAKSGYTATDANGNAINRGWAVDPNSGIWYFFNNYKMTTENLITTNGEIYYVGKDGAMTTGWVRFDEESEVKVNYDSEYRLFVEEIAAEGLRLYVDMDTIDGIGNRTFEDILDDEKSAYMTNGFWCYFGTDGKMAIDEWVCVDGLWSYIDGMFCVMDETAFYVEDTSVKNEFEKTDMYGFGADGYMLTGWQEVTEHKGYREYKPYQGADKGTSRWWVYYGSSEMVNAGWEKIDGKWYYFVSYEDDGDFVYNACQTNVFLTVDGKDFYMDDNGQMATGVYSIKGKKAIGHYTEDGTNGNMAVSSSAITVPSGKTYTFNFHGSEGKIQTGATGTRYYNNFTSDLVKVWVENDEMKWETVAGNKYTYGVWVTDDFLYEGKIDNNNSTNGVHFYDDGILVKDEAVKLFDTIVLFDSTGTMVTSYDRNREYAKIDGVKYVMDKEIALDGITLQTWKVLK